MRRLLLSILLPLWAGAASAQGMPFLQTFTAEDYGAHNINFDINVGTLGTVFVANFEGLLYYDHAEWNILHTSRLTRVTVVYRDKDGRIWVGGYNFLGRVEHKSNGELVLERMGNPNLFRGEVYEIWEEDGRLMFLVSNGVVYQIAGDQVTVSRKVDMNASDVGLTDVVRYESVGEGDKVQVLTDVTQELPLPGGQKVLVRKGRGLSIADADGREIYQVTKANGLTSDNVTWVDYDGHGRLWGACGEGLFSLAFPSAYTHFTQTEGLEGEVLSIQQFRNRMYVGTIEGLYCQQGQRFERVLGIDLACWNLTLSTEGLMAATTNGVWLITPDGSARHLSMTNTMSLMDDGKQFFCGESDGVWLLDKQTRQRRLVCGLDNVTEIVRDGEGTIWLRNTFGEVWYRRASDTNFRRYQKKDVKEAVFTFVPMGGKVVVVEADDTKPFPYPVFAYTDSTGVSWLTNHEGKQLYRWKDGRRLTDFDELLYPFSKVTIRALYVRDGKVWLGMHNGLAVIDTRQKDPQLETRPHLLIRRITLGGDSILWGGYGQMPSQLPELDEEGADLSFLFSLEYEALVGETVYRYRLDNGSWSAWTTDNEADFSKLRWGDHTFYVQGRDAFGRVTDVASVGFYISFPFYFRWYMIILYVILAGLLIYFLVRLRMRQLERDKIHLEEVVEERTAEVRSAQKKLIKQEKMATVGKLTQGLIDRILNPMNYINNFSKLSEGLVRDVRANVEDEKDHLDKENYEDTMEVLDMLSGNLQKIGKHGENTTRTLKAMEELLKDRSGGIVTTDLRTVMKQDEEFLTTYYAGQMKDHHIRFTVGIPDEAVYVEVNPELLSKVLMNLLGNSVYAVVKKAQRTQYQPEVSLKAVVSGGEVKIFVRDTGVGIEQQVIDKIFDPFFTTKTTSEASGIGLYLSHDIIQNYGGQITVSSVKDEYTEFTIILPIQTATEAYG